MKVELICDRDCPNVRDARSNLMRAFSRAGVHARWQEWDREDLDAPAYVVNHGSPTILVDGRDIISYVGEAPAAAQGTCCRVYTGEDGSLSGVPPVEWIARALAAAKAYETSRETNSDGGNVLSGMAAVPGLMAAFLPKVTCPMCWPAYAGALSALGLGFLLESAWLLPITGALFAVAVGSLAWRARERRGYGPFLLGLIAALALLVGKFVFESVLLSYGAAAVMVGAAVWNIWPRKKRCAACVAA